MLSIKYIATSFAACFLLAHTAAASTIVESLGNSAAGEPLGYYAPYAPYGITPIVYSVEWSQTATFTNVDAFANLYTPGSPGTVNYSLVKAIGSGTTFATEGILQGSATTPINPADVDLFHLNSLGPGTYYLVLDSQVPDTTWLYNYPFQSNYVTAPGVTFLGDQWSSGTSIDTAYTPGSVFSGTSIPVQFRITGTESAVPEPATFGCGAFAMLTFGMIRWRRSVKAANV